MTPFDFHTPPYDLVFEEEPDYNIIRQKVEILDTITKMNGQNICIIDFYKNNYFYISPNHIFNCGYSLTKIKEMGQKFPELIIYEEDMEKESVAKDAMCAFFATKNIKSQKEMTYFSSHRLKHKNGNILTILNQYKPFLFDSAGKMWMTIGISTLSTKNHFVESFIEVEGTNERFIFNPQKKDFNQIHKINLSNKEQQILILASQGYTSKEIAATQEVSLNTIKFHKQNILFKLNAQNISEAILYAYSHNLF